MDFREGAYMQKGLYKRFPLCGLFTDFKHHAKSWRNSKRMRAKRERQMLKKEVEILLKWVFPL